MLVASTVASCRHVHVPARDTRFYFFTYRFPYRFRCGDRDTCHSLSGLAGLDALVVGPGDFDEVVAWVSGWVVASSVGAVGPALSFHVFSCSWGGRGSGERRENRPPCLIPRCVGGCAGGLSVPEFAYVHSHVSGFLEGFYNGWLYFCPADLVVAGAAADA